jgi:hypothetical protein
MRVLVLLPEARRWPWQDRLVARLSQSHEVRIGHVPSQPYPWLLRRLLDLQARHFSGAAAPLPTKAAAPTAASGADSDLVLDLSETSQALEGMHVLRPLYDGSPDTLTLVARLLHRECPMLDIADSHDGHLIASSYAAVEDKQVLGRDLALAFARVEMLLLRACEQEGRPLSPMPARPARASRSFRAILLLRRSLRLMASLVAGPLTRRTAARPSHWNVAIRRRQGRPDIRAFEFNDYTPLPADRSTFYADPFVLEVEGRDFLFVEAYPYATAKGVIACAEVSHGGVSGPPRTVLERPYHLSYPYVVQREGGIFLIPETSAAGGLEIYRASAFPNEWVLERRLFDGLTLVDGTLFDHEGRLWLFATVKGEGGSDWDELFAWHAPGLAGPWTAHSLNPIKSDCRSARPAGRPIQVNGQLLRPAQRCERRYGESLVWLEVRALTPDAFVETEVAEWRSSDPRISGIHSADLSTAVAVIDFRSNLGD